MFRKYLEKIEREEDVRMNLHGSGIARDVCL